MKDYSAIAGQLGITHLIVISQTQQNVIMRLARFPDGPTLHFRINAYSLSRSVRATQRRPYDSPAACKSLLLCLRAPIYYLSCPCRCSERYFSL